MKTGFFAGTFDPVHIGHLRAALHIREEAGLDRLFFLPSGSPPNKSGSRIADSSQRLEMLRLAVKPWSFFGVSEFETVRTGPSFMCDTVKIMRDHYPDDDLFLLIGSDNLASLDTWKNWQEIFRVVSVISFKKSASDPWRTDHLAGFSEKVILSDAPVLEISSSEIRTRIKTGKSVDLLLPASVQNFINNNQLYLD